MLKIRTIGADDEIAKQIESMLATGMPFFGRLRSRAREPAPGSAVDHARFARGHRKGPSCGWLQSGHHGVLLGLSACQDGGHRAFIYRCALAKTCDELRAPLGQIGWATELATPDAKDMPAANNDTYYMSAVLDLTEPYVLTVPDTQDRYYVINVFNMWQEMDHYLGRRTTGTKAGKFVLVPPGWTGDLPQDAKRLDVTTSKVWLWGRLRVSQGEDTAPVYALQEQFTVAPLSGKPGPSSLPPLPPTGNDEFGFFHDLAAVLKDNPVRPADAALFAQFARIGLTDKGFDPSTVPEATRKGMIEGLADGPAVAISTIGNTSLRNG